MIIQANVKEAITIAKLAINMWPSLTIDELTADFEQLISDKNAAAFLYCIEEKAIGFAQCQLQKDFLLHNKIKYVKIYNNIFLSLLAK